jgi:hypothetical protein
LTAFICILNCDSGILKAGGWMTEKLARAWARGIWVWVFALLALRFAFPGDTVFIADEPLFQLKIDEHMARGAFPLTSFRGSSIPLPYGAGALWFYYLFRLFSWNPFGLAVYHIAAVSLGALLLIRVLRKYGEEPARWASLLLASSPILFFYSRHLWDTTLLLPIGACTLWCLQRLEDRRREILYHALLGAAAGYALNIHLMYGPVALALGFTLIFRSWKFYGIKSKRFWLPILAFGLCAALLLAPYLCEAYRIMGVEQPLENTKFTARWGDGRNFWWLLQRTVLFSSVWGSRIYFEGAQQQLLSFSGTILSFLFHIDIFGWFAKIATWFVIVAYPVLYYRGRAAFDPVRLFAFLSFVLILLVYQYLNIPTAPHYFEPVVWLVFLGTAIALVNARGVWKRFFIFTLVCTAIVNSALIISSLSFVHLNKGVRNMFYSVALGEQMRVVQHICVEAAARLPAEARVDLADTYISGWSFVYLAAHMPECKGVAFQSAHHLDAPNFRLRHPPDPSTKADLIVDWL